MKCPRCGHQIPDDSKFCPDCGLKIESLQNDPEDVSEILDKAFQLFQDENIEEAERLYRIVAQKNTTDQNKGIAFTNLAACKISQENYDEAIIDALKATDYLQDLATMANLGFVHYKLGDYNAARETYEKLTGIAEAYSSADFFLALCNLKLKNFTQVTGCFVSCLNKIQRQEYNTFSSVEEYLGNQLGNRYFNLQTGGKQTETMYCSDAYKLDKDFTVEILTYFSKAFDQIGDVKRAKECEKIIRTLEKDPIAPLDPIPPLDAKCRSILEEVEKHYERPNYALQLLKKIEQANNYKPHYEVMTVKARLLFLRDDEEECKKLLLASIKQNPYHADAVLLYAFLLENDEKYDEAIRLYNSIISYPSTSKDDILYANNNLGIVYNKLNKGMKASECYDKILENSYSGEIFFNKAFSLYQCGKYVAAIDYFEKAEQEDNELEENCATFLACCYIRLNDNNKALFYMKKRLSDITKKDEKEILSIFNTSKYYYYGVGVSSLSVNSVVFNEDRTFFTAVGKCASKALKLLGKTKQANAVELYASSL